MAHIRKVKVSKKDRRIDDIVVKDVDNEDSWEKGMEVQPRTKPTSIRLSPRTIQRAKFFARIHHQRGYQSWLKNILEERIDAEYELYKSIKSECVTP